MASASASASTSAKVVEDHDLLLGPGATRQGLKWTAPPSHLELVQVHYLVRHGERTPVRTRLQNAKPAIPTSWPYCHVGSEFAAAVADFAPGPPDAKGKSPAKVPDGPWRGPDSWRGKMDIRKGTENTDRHDRPVPGAPGECLLGELTDLGRQSTHALGQLLRETYIDKLGLLPQRLTPDDANAVYFRSTNMSRTVESAQSLIRGLLPQTRDSQDEYTPTLLIRNGTTENLLPNTFGCARLRALDAQFASMAAQVHNARLSAFDEGIAPHCDGAPPRIDGHPRLNGILDTVRAAVAHGVPFPSVFEEPDTMRVVERAVVDEWFSGYHAEDAALRNQYRRLAMGRLLNDLAGRLYNKATNGDRDPLKLAVYCAHDTSLAGLLSTLDAFDNRWPAFTASLGLELFRDRSPAAQTSILSVLGIGRSAPQHYVRLRYGDKTLKLPACAAKGAHLEGQPELCTLEAFKSAVEALRRPDGMSWEKECQEGRGSKSSK
ncbi:phosphoglycerate mutase-like protein [Ceraceosorus guamensis]|uniref:Phosphoglycerate mutase-like protein n=1 Tax=Ceraceosorus guamensis TaxID=1522189 RepID=A0A316W8C0_9BASI|nr:phosphoglycerate mutase-like protein [Ceraceosorus guamensis]PWN46109.1 phosphoglycerate mutase-like protein [Ceraceosorus guamensis]